MADGIAVELRIGDRGRPAFLATGAPALSWRVTTGDAGWRQTGWRLEVERDGRVVSAEARSAESQHIAWPAEPLLAYERARVRVALQDAEGRWSDPSAWVDAATGPLAPEDWEAELVALAAEPADDRGTARFRRVVDVRAGLARALLSLTSRGVHEAQVNGEPADDAVLAPGWTAYGSRLLARTADVTALLQEGPNVLSATLAEGWYRERFGFDGNFAVHYPGPAAFGAQLRLEYADGAVETVVTDGTWSASAAGPVVSASIYQGEHVDARLADAAATDPGTGLPGARPAVVVPFDRSVLEPQAAPPIRRIERLPVREVLTTPSGRTVLDFGQNLVGWLELRVDLPAGTELMLRHAEVLEHGELGTRPLRFAAATDRYVAAGGPATWSPRFTFHGFRYAEITGADLDPADVTAVVVHSDMVRTGRLSTSDPMLDRLHENVVWGMRGNFVGLPTDCPQRDERLGWTGDIQVFTPTAAYLYDVSGFLGSWLQDLAVEQGPDGAVPMVVPSPLPEAPVAAAAWGDAATLVPDALFARTGDVEALRRQYPSMRRWVEAERVRAGADLLWTGDFQFGDWLDPSAPPHDPAAAKTDGDLVASAYFLHSTRRLAAAAGVLGHTGDAAEYAALADRIALAFRDAFVTPSGRALSDAHTAYALLIAFGIVEGEQRRTAGERLAELVRAYGYRIRTGFVGTPLIADALTATGHTDVAYRLLQERGNPSWLYPVTMGATTIWERWDSMLPDGTINPGEMTSFNHYALGAVADWMQRTIGGIAPAAPGYRAVRIAPVPGGGLRSATASYDSGYGRIATGWTLEEDGAFRLSVEVPVGVTAEVVLPDGAHHEVTHGTHAFTAALPAPAEVHASFGMDSTLAELIDDPAARAAIEAFFARIGSFIGLGWTDSGRWRSDTRLRDSLLMMTPAQRTELEALLPTL